MKQELRERLKTDKWRIMFALALPAMLIAADAQYNVYYNNASYALCFLYFLFTHALFTLPFYRLYALNPKRKSGLFFIGCSSAFLSLLLLCLVLIGCGIEVFLTSDLAYHMFEDNFYHPRYTRQHIHSFSELISPWFIRVAKLFVYGLFVNSLFWCTVMRRGLKFNILAGILLVPFVLLAIAPPLTNYLYGCEVVREYNEETGQEECDIKCGPYGPKEYDEFDLRYYCHGERSREIFWKISDEASRQVSDAIQMRK